MTLHGSAVSAQWRPGDRVLLRLAGVQRAYTISEVDLRRRTFELIAVAHDRGPGGRWFTNVMPGESVEVFGPKPDLDPRTPGADRVVLLGDETTLGLFKAAARHAGRSTELVGALETEPRPDLSAELSFTTHLATFDRDPARPGARLHAWVAEQLPRGSRTVYFVSGHGAAVRSLRLTLIAMGVPAPAVRSRAYWGRA